MTLTSESLSEVGNLAMSIWQGKSCSTSTSFAQPFGISLSPDLKEAYIADCESSSIRALDLKTGGSRLLAGGDPFFAENLFKFCSLEIMMVRGLKFFNIHWVSCVGRMVKFILQTLIITRSRSWIQQVKECTVASTGKAGFKDGMAHVAQADSVSLGNGYLVWVENPDAAWIDGEIIEVNGEEIRVLCTSGKEVVKATYVCPKDSEAPPCGVDDVTKLAY